MGPLCCPGFVGCDWFVCCGLVLDGPKTGVGCGKAALGETALSTSISELVSKETLLCLPLAETFLGLFLSGEDASFIFEMM